MATETEFYAFFKEWEIKNFRASELLIHTTRPKNNIPPSEIWDNIIPTILILDELRDYFNVPIVLSSVYRSEAYNKTIPGSSRVSQHIAFTAIDFQLRGITPSEAAEVLKVWRKDGKLFKLPKNITRTPVQISTGTLSQKPLNYINSNGNLYFEFSGGIGEYNTFVHIDTRGFNRTC